MTFCLLLEKVCSHKLLILRVKKRHSVLHSVLLGLKLYFSLDCVQICIFRQKKFYFISMTFFPVFVHELNMLFVHHLSWANKNPYSSDTKALCISIEKELFNKSKKCFWCKPFQSPLLIESYHAIYLTLDKIQNRTSVHPGKPNHYVYNSFFFYFLSLCFQLKKLLNDSFT